MECKYYKILHITTGEIIYSNFRGRHFLSSAVRVRKYSFMDYKIVIITSLEEFNHLINSRIFLDDISVDLYEMGIFNQTNKYGTRETLPLSEEFEIIECDKDGNTTQI